LSPSEAVTWGKVDKDTYLKTTESMQGDYSSLMPFVVKALLDNRTQYEQGLRNDDKKDGYLRAREGYRLYDKREQLVDQLTEDVRNNKDWLLDTVEYPLAR
jgi:deoxyhypusine synthase